jgi:hypothetical protein
MSINTTIINTAKPVVELFDWIANNKNVRGSKPNDGGMWQQNSDKPKYFSPATRVIELEDGSRYLIKKETMSKALGLDKVSENVLRSLPGRE